MAGVYFDKCGFVKLLVHFVFHAGMRWEDSVVLLWIFWTVLAAYQYSVYVPRDVDHNDLKKIDIKWQSFLPINWMPVVYGSVYFRVRFAYEPNKRNKPTKQLALNTRCTAASHWKLQRLNCVAHNRRSGSGAASRLFPSRLSGSPSQTEPILYHTLQLHIVD